MLKPFESLPGIDQGIAERIVNHREACKDFFRTLMPLKMSKC